MDHGRSGIKHDGRLISAACSTHHLGKLLAIGMGHARALIGISDPAKQVELYHRIVESQMSVRAVEDMARTALPKGVKGSAKPGLRPNKDLSKQLAQRFGSKVSVKQSTEGKGKIEIAFRTPEELQRILAVLG